jgi:hypothetical protein
VTLRGEIRSIRTVRRVGAPGDKANSVLAVYGRGPDNRTSACHLTVMADGSVAVSSTRKSPDGRPGEVTECRSEFAAAEWAEICRTPENLAPYVCNRILDSREKHKVHKT